MRRRDAKKLVGDAWLESDYRIAWETRIMRRRVPLYKAVIAALRVLNKLSPHPRPSLAVTTWERVGPNGTIYTMEKLETMIGRTDAPVTDKRELHARTSFASRLARTISADEWPQIIAEYERRKRGERPQYHYVGHRPLNKVSHALMDKAWVMGEIPTDQYRRWLSDVKYDDEGALYSTFYTDGGSRDYPGAEAHPDFRRKRVGFDVNWKDKASLSLEARVLRRARILRARQLVKFIKAEIAYATDRRVTAPEPYANTAPKPTVKPALAPGSPRNADVAPPETRHPTHKPTAKPEAKPYVEGELNQTPNPAGLKAPTRFRPGRRPRPRDPYTPEVVAAVADFVKPVELRSPTARANSPPDTRLASVTATVAASGLQPVVAPSPVARDTFGQPRTGDASHTPVQVQGVQERSRFASLGVDLRKRDR